MQPLHPWTKPLDIVRISVYGQIVIAISAVQMYLGPLNSLRPAMLLLVAAVGAIALQPSLVAWQNMSDKYSKLILGLLFLTIAGSFFGLSMTGSLSFVINFYTRILIFFFLMVVSMRNTKDLALQLWAFLVSAGIIVVLALTVLDIEVGFNGLGRLQGNGSFDANDLGMLMLMGLPLAIFFSYNAAGPIGRTVSKLLVVGIPFTIALTGSRGAMVGLGFVAPCVFFVMTRVSLFKRLIAVGVLVVGLFIGAPAGYWNQMATIFTPSEDYNTTDPYGRMGLAKRGMGYMFRYPIFGVGANQFPRAEGTISPIIREREMIGEAVQWLAPHNTYAQIGAELGIGGLAIWLTLLYGGSIGLWRLRRKIPKAWDHESPERKFLREICLFLPVSFIGFAVTSFFLSHAYTPPAYIFFAYLVAVHVQVRRELRRGPLRPGQQVVRPGRRGRRPPNGPHPAQMPPGAMPQPATGYGHPPAPPQPRQAGIGKAIRVPAPPKNPPKGPGPGPDPNRRRT